MQTLNKKRQKTQRQIHTLKHLQTTSKNLYISLFLRRNKKKEEENSKSREKYTLHIWSSEWCKLAKLFSLQKHLCEIQNIINTTIQIYAHYFVHKQREKDWAYVYVCLLQRLYFYNVYTDTCNAAGNSQHYYPTLLHWQRHFMFVRQSIFRFIWIKSWKLIANILFNWNDHPLWHMYTYIGLTFNVDLMKYVNNFELFWIRQFAMHQK